MVARICQTQKLLLCHVQFLHNHLSKRQPLALIVDPRRGAVLADHIVVAEHIPERNVILRHKHPRQLCGVPDGFFRERVLPRGIAAAKLDADGVFVPTFGVLLHVDPGRPDAPCRVSVVHRLHPAKVIHKIMRRGLHDVLLKIAKIALRRVVVPRRVVEHQIADCGASSRAVISGVRGCHLSLPAPTAAASTMPSDII